MQCQITKLINTAASSLYHIHMYIRLVTLLTVTSTLVCIGPGGGGGGGNMYSIPHYTYGSCKCRPYRELYASAHVLSSNL